MTEETQLMPKNLHEMFGNTLIETPDEELEQRIQQSTAQSIMDELKTLECCMLAHTGEVLAQAQRNPQTLTQYNCGLSPAAEVDLLRNVLLKAEEMKKQKLNWGAKPPAPTEPRTFPRKMGIKTNRDDLAADEQKQQPTETPLFEVEE